MPSTSLYKTFFITWVSVYELDFLVTDRNYDYYYRCCDVTFVSLVWSLNGTLILISLLPPSLSLHRSVSEDIHHTSAWCRIHQRKNEKGRNKEDLSYTPMCYDFILQSTYYNFVDIFRSFSLKPYLTESVHEACPQLPDLLQVWCYQIDCTKEDSQSVAPTFQVLTKSGGKTLDGVHAQKVLYRRDIWVSPLLPTMWTLLYNIKKHLDVKSFSMNRCNIFKFSRHEWFF
jgi:hypothetical protein